jgi:hypothetical protein
MTPKRKITFYYASFAAGLLVLLVGIFGVMYSIESFTSYLEVKLWRRNLGDIVDQKYYLEIEERKDTRVEFLVELTKFFNNFHENTVDYKRKLEDFMMRRERIRQRLDRTNMRSHNMTIVPNELLDEGYVMKPHTGNTHSLTATGKKQFPFSQILTFGQQDLQYYEDVGKRNDVYLMCTARVLAIAKDKSTVIKAQISEWNEKVEDAKYIRFRIRRNFPKVLILNRVLRLRDVRRARIVINGIAAKPIVVQKVEAECVSFTDVRALPPKEQKQSQANSN